jgi:uncharacterized membrane protein YeaQ/YmgE (transglycosylase-associated protein family)
MRHITGKHIAILVGAFAATSIALLWSWNTLAPLFDGPVAEFKHVLAAMVGATVLRVIVSPLRRHQVRHQT